ncbi:MAG: hypothetical protein ACRDE7_12370, partial [Sphingobacterium sp.]
MIFFTIKSDDSGTNKVLYPLIAVAKISEETDPHNEIRYTEIILSDGTQLKVQEPIEKVEEFFKKPKSFNENHSFTNYELG